MADGDEEASARDLLALALEYHRAAKSLAPLGRRGEPLSRAPYRLLAIHAIELYLSALLRHQGVSGRDVKALGHDLGRRVERAEQFGLTLRTGTRTHLVALSANQEYLMSRYRPDQLGRVAPPNRLAASLREIAQKVAGILARPSTAKAA